MLNVSVIIPNYNNSAFLEKSVSSVMTQDYLGIAEILIVDDCSTDDSRNLILELEKKDSRIKHIFLEKNHGVSYSRNAGIRAANSDYVTCLDADDFYENKSKICYEMELIEKFRDSGKDIIAYSIMCSCNHDGKDILKKKKRKSYYYRKKTYLKLLLDFNSKKVFRDYCVKKEALEKVGLYKEGSNLFEDYELLLKLTKLYEAYCTYNFGTVYRDSISGLSKRPQKVLVRTKNKIIKAEIKTNGFFLRQCFRILRLFVSIIKCPKKVFNFLKNIFR